MTLKCLNFHNLNLFTCNIILHQKNGQYRICLKIYKICICNNIQ